MRRKIRERDVMSNRKTALVCGAGGFIGNHMVRRLKKEGYWVNYYEDGTLYKALTGIFKDGVKISD